MQIDSPFVLSTTFTDEPLNAGMVVRALHILELRTRIGLLRQRYSLPVFNWVDGTLSPGTASIKAVHVSDLRTALNDVYIAANGPLPPYTDPSPVPGVTIKAAHINEVRTAILAIE